MLTALVVNLDFLTKPSQRGTYASAARQWLVAALSERLPDVVPHFQPLADNVDTVPFTVSGLLRDTSDKPYLRFTALNSAASQGLRALVMSLPTHITLGEQNIPIIGATTDADVHPDAGQTTYMKLIAAAQPSNKFGFRLMTPLSFRSAGQDAPLPEPVRFFGSLLRRWECFTGEDALLPMNDFIRENVALSYFRLNSVVHHETRSSLGGVGVVRFRVQRRRDVQDWQHRLEMLDILRRFAFYSGVGMKTAWGMGQVRSLEMQ